MADKRPIGLFDSGVGGLTVLGALRRRLPYESTVYLGDLARCPYGTLSQEDVLHNTVECADLLASQDIKLMVVACNTATAAAYETLRARYPFPVVGVIDPGVEEAVRVTRNSRIGVIATAATVASGVYRQAVLQRLPGATVVERSASSVVPLIEAGVTERVRLEVEVFPALSDMVSHHVDTLILGCTHFPLVFSVFEAGAGRSITLLDPADSTAQLVERLLSHRGMLGQAPARHRFLVTGGTAVFIERARSVVQAPPHVELVALPHMVDRRRLLLAPSDVVRHQG